MPLSTSEVSVNNTPLPVTGTVAATQSGSWTVALASGSIEIGTVDQGTPASVANSWPIKITDGTDTALVSATGELSISGPVSQLGTWNINNISGTISLPTGASTSALQTSGNASLTSIDGKTPALGQATMAASSPVVIASNQSAVPVTGPLTDTQLRATAVPVSLTSTTITGSVAVTGPLTDTQLRATAVPVSGTVTANAGTGNFTVVQTTGTNLHTVVDSGSITVANASLPVTQSGTWTVQPGNTANTTPWLSTISQGGNSATVTAANALKVDGSAVTQPVSFSAPTSATVTANSVGSGAAVTLLASRAARVLGVIYNEAGTLFVKAGSAASSTDYTWRLTANTELDITNYSGIVTAIKSAGTTNVQATDF